MKTMAIIGACAASLIASGASGQPRSFADDAGGMPRRGVMGRISPEDMGAMMDAHIAALHAGLKLSPEQEKLWPPVEEAMRAAARAHVARMQAMRSHRGSMEEDPIGTLRTMADAMSQGAESMRRLADAGEPLYESLDEAQKRRLHVLARMGPGGMMGLRGMGALRRWYGRRDGDDAP
jgi:hypothetical protein